MNFQYINKYCIHWNNRAEQIIPKFSEIDFDSFSCNLTIGLYPYEMLQSPNNLNLSYICGAYNELINIIHKYLKCHIGFKVCSESIGGHWVNGTYDGILRLLWEEKIDFIPHLFTISKDRYKLLKSSNIIAGEDKIAILSFPRFVYKNNPWIIFSFLSWPMWIMVFISFICFSIFHWMDLKRVDENVGKTRIGKIMTETFGLLVAIGTIELSIQPKRIKSNPLIIWIFISFLIRQLFSSDITSLILSKTELRFDNIDQLLEHENYGILVKETSIFNEYSNLLFRYSSIIKRSQIIPHSNYYSIETIKRLVFEKNVCLLSKENVKRIAEFYPKYGFHVSRESYISSVTAFPIRKNLNQTLRLGLIKLLKNIYQHGLDRKIDHTVELQNYKFVNTKITSEETTIMEGENEKDRKQVVYESSKQMVIRILSIYGIGIFISFVFFLSELALKNN